MPFTLSHPAAAVMLRRTGLPMAAMVSGTVVPDAPMFLHTSGYGLTHSLMGILTADLLLGMVGLLAWCLLLRDPLVDSAPRFIRERFPAHVAYSRRQWYLAPVAVVVGALTHVGWDELTHEGRWGPAHIGWLRATHFGAAGYHWAQAVSGIAGLIVVLAAVLGAVARNEPTPRAAVVPQLAGRASWGVVGVAAITGFATVAYHAHDGLHEIAFASALTSVAALATAAVVASFGWRLLAQRSR